MYSPIILLTENLRCLTGRPFESFNRRSNALYRLGVLSATETSQKPIPCDAANDAPSDSLTCARGINSNEKRKYCQINCLQNFNQIIKSVGHVDESGNFALCV